MIKHTFISGVKIIIRPLEPKDIPECIKLTREGWDKKTAQAAEPDFRDAFTPGAWRPFYYVAELEGSKDILGIAGYGSSSLYYGVYEIFFVAVRNWVRNQGLGRILVSTCLDDLKFVADVVMLITDIPEYYKKHWNFKTITDVKLSGSKNDVLMMLQLPTQEEEEKIVGSQEEEKTNQN